MLEIILLLTSFGILIGIIYALCSLCEARRKRIEAQDIALAQAASAFLIMQKGIQDLKLEFEAKVQEKAQENLHKLN